MKQKPRQHGFAGLRTYARVLKPGEYKKREDSIDIFITDYAVHSQQATNPRSLVRNVVRSQKSGKHQRTFGKIHDRGNGQLEASFDFDEEELMNQLWKRGKRQFRIYMRADGVPVHLADDALEKLRSIQKKLNKQK